MINTTPINKMISITQDEQYDTLKIVYHNETCADEMVLLFREALFVMGYTIDIINEVLPDPFDEV